MSFKDDVLRWCKKAENNVTEAHKLSIAYLGEEMARTKPQGGNVPFLTGNLARSLMATKSEHGAGNSVGVVAATLKPNESVWIGYTASYARRRNYGLVGKDSLGRMYNETGDYFLEKAIAKWDEIVRRAIDDATSRQ